MRRRDFITILGGAATWPVVAHAQRAHRIGVLETTSAALIAANFDALRQGLRQHGYIEGQNLGRLSRRQARPHAADCRLECAA